MRDITWGRDEAGNRLWTGKRATYRVISMTGPWLVEILPPERVEADVEHDDSNDTPLLTLEECKVFIDACEDLGDVSAAYKLTLVWRNTKKA